MINELAKEIYTNNVSKGFYEDKKNIGEMLCLIHSEVSEALESDREDRYSEVNDNEGWEFLNNSPDDISFVQNFKGTIKDTFEDELADIVIRVMDLSAYKGIDLESHIKAKMRYNSLREYKHGKKY